MTPSSIPSLPLAAAALRSRIEIDPHRNAESKPTNSGNVPDPSGPLKRNLSPTACRTFTCAFSKNGCVTIRTWLCFKLEQIRDHFYYTNGGHLINESGLRFAISQSIKSSYTNTQVHYNKNLVMLRVRANPRPLLLYKWGAFD